MFSNRYVIFFFLYFGAMCTKAVCDEDVRTQDDEHIFYVIC